VAAEPSMPSLPVAPVTVADVPALAMVPAPAPYHRPRGAKRVVVIDPGHGGIDPGATGVSGVHEKDITLAAARELKRQIDLGGHFRAVLTRTQDSFLPLRERVAIARANHADLFISLHADSIEAKGVSGSSVYTLSDRASDSEAAQLAAKENKADAIAGADLNAYPEEVAGILIDLAQRETRNDSNKYAHTLVVQLDQSGRVLEHSVRSAGFAVLKAPDVPSVLLEMGYLSNPNEERELRDPRYRAKLMGAIKRAIELYFAALDRMTRS
jgi:N-acetylmuramoyl-L-alanine amidase